MECSLSTEEEMEDPQVVTEGWSLAHGNYDCNNSCSLDTAFGGFRARHSTKNITPSGLYCPGSPPSQHYANAIISLLLLNPISPPGLLPLCVPASSSFYSPGKRIYAQCPNPVPLCIPRFSVNPTNSHTRIDVLTIP